MTEVQKVFDKVFESGYYSEFTEHGSVLMCHALKNAARQGAISKEEFILAKEEIKQYLGAFGSLGGLLDFKGEKFHFTARIAIYENWANRPKFKDK